MKALLKYWHIWMQNCKIVSSRIFGTRMVGGFVRGDGIFLSNTRISNTSFIFSKNKLQIEDHVFIGHFSVLDATYGLHIEEGCQIGFFTGIFTHSSHAAIRLYGREYVNESNKKSYFTAPIKIGKYSFIGAHATLLPGTKIGKGSIVSAYSLVSGQYPDFAILSGQPAQIIGDTRKMDARLLTQHPELAAHYAAWAGELPRAEPGHG
ncbi:acyltransferase [Diaphorobacter nitroreducens]|uniref:acyltransferase n=1 Tax=Diaphorobacter nitroreducens TaxID=164759 RepID=UPI0028AED952|nr:acyltransferase [Diaphorobacter nitroreducens]